MIYANVDGIRKLALEVCRKQNKDITFLTKTHVNHDQIQQIRNNWLGNIFFFPKDSLAKGLLVLLHLGLEDVAEVDTDPRERFKSLKVTPSNDRVLCFYTSSRYSTREQLVKESFFEGLQNYLENKCEGNENKITFGEFNNIID